MKKVIVLCLIIIIMPAIVSCKRPDNSAPVRAADDSQDAAVYDNYGRQVIVASKPEKVLTLGPNCTELFVALGLSDYVIGNTLNNHSRGALLEYREAYEAIPELNYSSATREAVVASGADFIYGIDWEFSEEGLDVSELESYGMAVYMNAAATFEEIYKEIIDLGKIFEIEAAAEAFVADQQQRIEAVKNSTGNREPIKVLVYDSGGDGVFTCGGNNFETLLIEAAGGKNIFDDITDKQWTTVSYEEILKRNPDIILIHDYDAPSLEEKIQAIKSDEALSQLDCVKEERFGAIALESVLPGGRMAYTVETLSEIFLEYLK